jgi:HK97 gp10 family phage protein
MADDSGLSRIQARMRAIPEAVQDAAKSALAKGADDIVAMARSLCPIDSGALRDSIGWVWGDVAPNGARVIATSRDMEGITITIYAGNDEAYYASFVENGTKAGKLGERKPTSAVSKRKRQPLTRKVRRTHPGIKARPFFFPAYHLNKKKVASRLRRAVNKAIKANWGKS